MKLLVGTSNKNKIGDVKRFLQGSNVEILSTEDINVSLEIEENGQTPIQNATIKALAYHRKTGLMVTSMDSGLYFYGMDKEDIRQPGLFVRRVNGRELTDEEMIDYYSGIAKEYGGQIKCSYYTGFSIVIDENHIYEYMDDDETASAYSFYLVDKPHKKRTPGWPLDSLSVDEVSGMYYMDLIDLNEVNYPINHKKERKKEERIQSLMKFYAKALGVETLNMINIRGEGIFI
jgi:inosine/xanthosine triphosphate pyrophosphatase family protein